MTGALDRASDLERQVKLQSILFCSVWARPMYFFGTTITPQADMGPNRPVPTSATRHAVWQHSRRRQPMFSKVPVTRAGGPGQGAG